MLLSAKLLDSVASVNLFQNVKQIRCFEGDAPCLYFMLIDRNLDRPEEGYSPAGRRYIPAAGATLSVVLDNLDDARKVTRAATQPYPQDPSMWAVQLLTTDTPRGTVNFKLTLTEPGSPVKITRGIVLAALCIDPGSALDSSIGWTGGTIPDSYDSF